MATEKVGVFTGKWHGAVPVDKLEAIRCPKVNGHGNDHSVGPCGGSVPRGKRFSEELRQQKGGRSDSPRPSNWKYEWVRVTVPGRSRCRSSRACTWNSGAISPR